MEATPTSKKYSGPGSSSFLTKNGDKQDEDSKVSQSLVSLGNKGSQKEMHMEGSCMTVANNTQQQFFIGAATSCAKVTNTERNGGFDHHQRAPSNMTSPLMAR